MNALTPLTHIPPNERAISFRASKMSATKKFFPKRPMSQALVVIEPMPVVVEELDESDEQKRIMEHVIKCCDGSGCDECTSNAEDDDDESVHSTCCVDCEESFQFDEPVSAEDYSEGLHEMRCPKCREGPPEAKPTGVQRFMTAFGRAPTEIERSVLNACEFSSHTAKQIVASLKATYPDINKKAVNSILYKALTKGLVGKMEKPDVSAPSWWLKE